VARSRYRSVFSQGSSSGVGSRLLRVLLVLVLLILVGGVVAIGFVDIEPPTETVEKEIPPERFQGR
jgi:hypothetical protein